MEILQGLVSPDRHTRKLAKHALMTTRLANVCASCSWERFWTIYDSADEYSGHLFKSVFSDTVNLFWCDDASRTENCLTTDLVSVIIQRVLTHENDHVVKYAVSELAGSKELQLFVIEKKILRMSSFLDALEQSPALLVKRIDSGKISLLISNCIEGMCFDPKIFLMHVLAHAKLFYPVIHCYLDAISVTDGIDIDESLLQATHLFISSKIRAFPAVLRPTLVRAVREFFFANDSVISTIEKNVTLLVPYLTLQSSVGVGNPTQSERLRDLARNFVLNCVFIENTPIPFESINGAAGLIGRRDIFVNEFVSELVHGTINREYASDTLKRNALFSAIAFANGLSRPVISSLLQFENSELIPGMIRLMEAGARLGQGEVRFHESRFLDILSTVAPSDKEKFDLTVSLMVLAHSDISLLDANSLFGRLFGFNLDRVSPDFALPKSLSSLFLRMDSRDSLHDQFFRFKFILLNRLITKSTNAVATEDLLEQYRTCASSYLMELNVFTFSLLEGGLVQNLTEFLVEYCDMCYDFLSNRDSQLNSDFCIKSTLRIVFFESAHVDKGINSARVGLMKKLLTIAEENHPLIGRYSVPVFVEFLKRSTVVNFSDDLIDLICDLITHKEGFDETQVEGLEFGLNQVKRWTPLSAEVEATSAYTRILTLTVIRELNDVELVDRIAVNLLDRILTAQIEIEKKGVPQTPLPFTAFHRSQLRIYQAVAYLAPLVSQETFSKKIEDYLFGPLLQWSNQPDARDYLETLAIFFIDRFRLSLQSVISVLKNYNLPSQAIASFVVIGGHAVRDEKLKLDERRELALHLIPFLSSNVSYIRGVAQQWLSAVHAQGFMGELGLDNPIINNLMAFMSQNKESIQLRKKLTPVFAYWNPIESIRSGKILALCASGAMFKNSELVPCLVFMDAVREGVHEAMKDNWFFTRDFDTLINDHIIATRDSINSEEKFPISNSQRKYVPQIGSLFPGLEQESKTRRAMTELIVVTTLVEKSTNIAGLCRSAEVFGAKRLVVPKLSVLKESQFSAMSVTAEQWIDVQEVTEARLSVYLSEMKSVGYTVVCLEQTHDSVEIQEYEFPEKCCLVLGNEKSGVPVEFLPCMDVCVEIPQRGVIRSLNVHVSGAIAMWQYNRFR